ncbi:MAG: YajQ family cyclic di-GMP-binding protein [Bryobacterales bacterium]|nr:YajQ family cyclic di-GMP-binding protein [Bryobacterales bacterium]
MPDNSFDIVSKVEIPEVQNAIQQALKEITTRFDLKNSHSTIELREKDNLLVLASADEFQLKAVIDILEAKLVKRQVPLKNFEYGEAEPAAGQSVRMEVKLQQGLATEKAKDIVKAIKDSKIKVTPSIMGDYVRIASKSRDLLQDAIQLIKSKDFGVALQFTNYR